MVTKKEFNELLYKVGEKLRKIRISRKLSILTVSIYCEIDKSYLGDIELGKRNPSILVLYKLTNYYGITLKELFDFDK